MASPVFLLGFMGTGKTTLGRALEARMPLWRYLDLDDEIQRRAGMSIPRIFANYGEKVFRQMEREALDEVLPLENVIIGCGGGTPCFFDNMDRMNAAGITVWLQARPYTLLRRLIVAQATRPKLNGMSHSDLEAYIASETAAREPFYSRARHTFPSDLLESPAEVEASCRFFIRKFIPES